MSKKTCQKLEFEKKKQNILDIHFENQNPKSTRPIPIRILDKIYTHNVKKYSDLKSCKFSEAKVENVVNPPQKPTISIDVIESFRYSFLFK